MGSDGRLKSLAEVSNHGKLMEKSPSLMLRSNP